VRGCDFARAALRRFDHDIFVVAREVVVWRTGVLGSGRTAALNRLGSRRVEPGRLEAMWIATGCVGRF